MIHDHSSLVCRDVTVPAVEFRTRFIVAARSLLSAILRANSLIRSVSRRVFLSDALSLSRNACFILSCLATFSPLILAWFAACSLWIFACASVTVAVNLWSVAAIVFIICSCHRVMLVPILVAVLPYTTVSLSNCDSLVFCFWSLVFFFLPVRWLMLVVQVLWCYLPLWRTLAVCPTGRGRRYCWLICRFVCGRSCCLVVWCCRAM
jgi:Zn-dependent protease with chaperone function